MASVAAYLAATNYSEFLLGGRGFTFDKTDPVFGMDIGFYAFDLPNIWVAWRYLTWAAFLFLCFSVACANAARGPQSRGAARRRGCAPGSRLSATPATRVAWALLGILAADRRLADPLRPALEEQLRRLERSSAARSTWT